jgi:hypothetical protein
LYRTFQSVWGGQETNVVSTTQLLNSLIMTLGSCVARTYWSYAFRTTVKTDS